MNDRIKQLKK
ncbi:Protein of unknown function [Lactobacillus delbrueckii subsp. lactis]|nr:Protein of unknown function [Lactobacillus delbrueckii subsp. lactis]